MHIRTTTIWCISLSFSTFGSRFKINTTTQHHCITFGAPIDITPIPNLYECSVHDLIKIKLLSVHSFGKLSPSYWAYQHVVAPIMNSYEWMNKWIDIFSRSHHNSSRPNFDTWRTVRGYMTSRAKKWKSCTTGQLKFNPQTKSLWSVFIVWHGLYTIPGKNSYIHLSS